ncbi:MAG: hypothetical protein AB7K71_35000 [Polyangiaceae bacterium]
MGSKVSPALVGIHALCTLAVLVIWLPIAFGVIAQRAMGVDLFDPGLGGEPTLLTWADHYWSQAALLASFLTGLAQLALLVRDPGSKAIHRYHVIIGTFVCVFAYLVKRTPQLWAAVPMALLALLYIGFWSRRLMDPDSR